MIKTFFAIKLAKRKKWFWAWQCSRKFHWKHSEIFFWRQKSMEILNVEILKPFEIISWRPKSVEILNYQILKHFEIIFWASKIDWNFDGSSIGDEQSSNAKKSAWGWPDWANVRRLGDFLFGHFLKITVAQIFGLLFP
jgi:hypothetical protein